MGTMLGAKKDLTKLTRWDRGITQPVSTQSLIGWKQIGILQLIAPKWCPFQGCENR